MTDYCRADGVPGQHDPQAPGIVDTYGAVGQIDEDSFNPKQDIVGPGIYGGKVKRDTESGEVLYGVQCEEANPRRSPIYAGGGYTEVSAALRRGPQAVGLILERDMSLVNEISTGGATPLHMCGMGEINQLSTEYIVKMGGDVNAVDTYGHTALHRMAANNLPVGAEALCKAGANVSVRTAFGETPLQTAMQSRAVDVIRVLKKHGATS